MQPYIQSFGIKDPNDTRPKNFDAAGALAASGNPTIASYSVSVAGILNADGSMPAGGAPLPDDGGLAITDVAWDAVRKRVSFRWRGGTLGVWYLVTCRIAAADPLVFSADQSAKVFIANK